MDGGAIYLRLAEVWHRAAREATNTTLKTCYADRAAGYREKAARECGHQDTARPKREGQ